jgi:hypothetical protein
MESNIYISKAENTLKILAELRISTHDSMDYHVIQYVSEFSIAFEIYKVNPKNEY